MPEENPSFMPGRPHGPGRIQAPAWWETLRRAELPDEPERNPTSQPGQWMTAPMESPAPVPSPGLRSRLRLPATIIIVLVTAGIILLALLRQG